MPGEIGLCLSTFVFFVFLWILRQKKLRLKFPIYGKIASLNWNFFYIIFGIILSYFTGIMAINIFHRPTPKIPFRTFQDLKKLVEQKEISLIVRSGGAGVAMVNEIFSENSIKIVKNVSEALEIVKKEQKKVFLEFFSSIFGVESINSDCDLITISDNSFPEQFAGILFSKSAPKWLRNLPLPTANALRTVFERYERKYRPNFVDFNCIENPIRPLKIQQIFSSFFLIFGGFFFASIVFAIEKILGRKKSPRPKVLKNFSILNLKERQGRKRRSRSSPPANFNKNRPFLWNFKENFLGDLNFRRDFGL